MLVEFRISILWTNWKFCEFWGTCGSEY